MICEICRLKINKKRTIFNLFETEIHHICESCLSKHPVDVSYQVIPKDEGIIKWYALLHETTDLNPMAYMSFLKPFYKDYVKNNKDSIYLYFDSISDKLMIILQSLEFKYIYLVTLYDEINEKEQAYVI